VTETSPERIPVVVAGVGSTGPNVCDPRSIPEMVLEAVQAALSDAGIGCDDVDGVVTSSVDLFDGLTASNIAVTEVVGAVMKPETRIAADGLCAAVHATCQIRAGAYRTVLVVAHGKASMAPASALTPWAMDPVLLQPMGIDFDVCAGLQASVLAGDEAERRWAARAVQRRADAAPGGVAAPCTASDVLNSPPVAAPLRDDRDRSYQPMAFRLLGKLGDPGATLTLRSRVLRFFFFSWFSRPV